MVGCVVLACASYVLAEDWPQWGGPTRNEKVAGFTAPTNWPTTLTSKWKVKVGAGDATPALVGDKLYVFARDGGDEVTLCLNADDGKEIWRDKNAVEAVTGPSAAAHAGPRSSPAVADGKVVTLGVTGVVSCLDAAKGTVVWRKDDVKGWPRFYTATSPLIVDGLVIAHLGGSGKGQLVAYDLADGKVKWSYDDKEGPGYASPVMLTADGVKQLVTLTEKSVIGVNLADGKLLWQVPFAPKGMSYNAATPVVDGTTVIVSGQGRGTKAFKIAKEGDAFGAKELWTDDKSAVLFCTPILKDGLLYGLSDAGNFFCVTTKDGVTAWTDTVKRGSGRNANYCAMVDAGSVILALPSTGELIAFKPGDKEYSELAKIKVADTATFAFPVIAGKRVFVKDQDSVTLWTFE
jgi:outer membrane protein assembly factor BamB